MDSDPRPNVPSPEALDALLTRRDALLPKMAEHPELAALQREWQTLKSEIEATRTAIAQRLVDRIEIAAPCSADWAAMSGGERVRHCRMCEKNVYAVNGMSAVEIATLMMEHEGSLCLRLHRRPDGTVLTSDCEVGQKARKRRLRVLGGFAAAAMAGLAAGAAVGTLTAPEPAHLVDVRPKVREHTIVMGAIAGPVDVGRDAQLNVDAFLSSSQGTRLETLGLGDAADVMAGDVGDEAAEPPERVSPPAPTLDDASE